MATSNPLISFLVSLIIGSGFNQYYLCHLSLFNYVYLHNNILRLIHSATRVLRMIKYLSSRRSTARHMLLLVHLVVVVITVMLWLGSLFGLIQLAKYMYIDGLYRNKT